PEGENGFVMAFLGADPAATLTPGSTPVTRSWWLVMGGDTLIGSPRSRAWLCCQETASLHRYTKILQMDIRVLGEHRYMQAIPPIVHYE
ncbi:hypothetical protein P7K49_011717, partial [Saguinus oedipus]